MSEQPQTAVMYCRHGGSDKEYRIQLRQVPGRTGWITTSQYGRRGSTMNEANPMKSTPGTYADAYRVFMKLYHDKSREYTEDARGDRLAGLPEIKIEGGSTITPTLKPELVKPVITALPVKSPSGYFPQLPTPWDEEDIEELLADEDYVGQEKCDGEYRGILIAGDDLKGTNKKGEWVELSATLQKDAQQINAGGVTCFLVTEDLGETAVVHDILQWGFADLSSHDCEMRLIRLRKVFEMYPNLTALRQIKTAYNEAAKRQMYADLKAANAEGMIFKRLHATWQPGNSKDVWKVKFYALNCFIVTKVNTQRSVRLGLYDDAGKMVDLGNCTIPVNVEIPAEGSLLDVRYLYAFPGGKLYQPVYQCPRLDAIAEQCLVSKLKFVRELE
jgi:bifunctional non-homologous end joining protein LigD